MVVRVFERELFLFPFVVTKRSFCNERLCSIIKIIIIIMGGGEEKVNNPFLSESFAPLDALKDEELLARSKTLFDDDSYPLFDHIGKCRFMLPKNHPDFFDDETKLALPKQSEESKQKQVRGEYCFAFVRFLHHSTY